MLTPVQGAYHDRVVVVDDVEEGPRPAPGKPRSPNSSYDGLIREGICDDPIGRFAGSVQKPLLKCSIAFRGGLVKLIQSSPGELDATHAGFGRFRSLARR